MAGHVINPATKFEDPMSILSWVTSFNVSLLLPLKMRTAAILLQIIRWKLKIRIGNRAHCIQHAWIVKKSRSPLLPQNAPNMHILRNASSLSNPPHRYENSHAIRDHTVIPATRQSWHFRLYPNHFTFRLDLPLKLFAKTEVNPSFGFKPNFRSWLSSGLKL